MNVVPCTKRIFPFGKKNTKAIHLTALIGAIAIFAIPSQDSFAANVYDTRILERMKFSKDQRAKVMRIIRQSDKDLYVVFEKHGIDPEDKPILRKLIRASKDLKVIERREKRQMKEILNEKQYKEYLSLLWETASNVINATRRED